jgi:acetate kinase
MLDPAKNERGEELVSASNSRCMVRVIKTDEDVVIARHAHRVVRRLA